MGIYPKITNLLCTPAILFHHGSIIIKCSMQYSYLCCIAMPRITTYAQRLYATETTAAHVQIDACIRICGLHKEEQQNWFTTQSVGPVIVKCRPIGLQWVRSLDTQALCTLWPSGSKSLRDLLVSIELLLISRCKAVAIYVYWALINVPNPLQRCEER